MTVSLNIRRGFNIQTLSPICKPIIHFGFIKFFLQPSDQKNINRSLKASGRGGKYLQPVIAVKGFNIVIIHQRQFGVAEE